MPNLKYSNENQAYRYLSCSLECAKMVEGDTLEVKYYYEREAKMFDLNHLDYDKVFPLQK